MSLSHYSFLRPCGHFDVLSTIDVVVVVVAVVKLVKAKFLRYDFILGMM